MSIVEDRLRGWPGMILVLSVAAVLLSPALFSGFELCDTGFYMTFYDNIFRNPESVSYNFMYWLSGVIGGAVSELSGASLFAVRCAGLVADLICVLCVCRLMWPLHLKMAALLGVTAVACGVLETPLAFYNDTLTALLAVISLALLIRDGHWSIAAAGFVAALNAFARIPNILDFFFVVLIFFLPRNVGKTGRNLLADFGCWSAGWIAGIGAGFGLAALLGHAGLLIDSIRELTAIGGAGAEESTHSAVNLIKALIDTWLKIGKLAIRLACVGGAAVWVMRRRPIPRWLGILISTMFAVSFLINLVEADTVISLAAVSAVGCLIALFDGTRPKLRAIAAAGLLMMIILPAGSDYGIYNAGTIILWIAAPVGFATVMVRIGKIPAIVISAVISISCLLHVAEGGFYFDNTPIAEMTATVKSDNVRAAYTSSARAERMNRMFAQLREHVNPGDTLMVFGSAPMINHVTRTVPALGCSWPELMSAARLRSALSHSKPPRYVMMLKFKTLGGEWGSPSDGFMRGEGSETNHFHNAAKSQVVIDYIRDNNYREIINASDFVLYSK